MWESSAVATLACSHTAECASSPPNLCYVTPLDTPVLCFAQKAVRTGAWGGAALEDGVSASCSVAANAALQPTSDFASADLHQLFVLPGYTIARKREDLAGHCQ